MQKYISLFFSVLLFLTACKSKELPKDVLNEQDMLNLMLDIHITDGTVYQVPQVPDSLFKYSSAKFAVLFKRHHTTDVAYKTSLKYYSKQPEKIQELYTKLETLLKGKIDSLNKASAAEAAKIKPVQSKAHRPDSVSKPPLSKPSTKKLLNSN